MKINKIDKLLSRIINKKREKTQINKNRNEREESTTDTIEIQRNVRNYYEKLYAKKFETLGKMEKFLWKYNLTKLNEEEAKTFNRTISASDIKAVIKNLLAPESLWPDDFTGEFYKTWKKELYISFLDYSKKSKKMDDTQTLVMRPASS